MDNLENNAIIKKIMDNEKACDETKAKVELLRANLIKIIGDDKKSLLDDYDMAVAISNANIDFALTLHHALRKIKSRPS